MKAIAFAPLMTAPGHKGDAGWFQHEARAFAALHGVDPSAVYQFDNGADMVHRRAQIKHWLESQSASLDCVAFFCHGWAPTDVPPIVRSAGIQAGYQPAQVGELAASIKIACVQAPVINLYCCSTGQDLDPTTVDIQVPGPGGEGGFADLLRHALDKIGVASTIFAHESVGNASTNPYIRRFPPGFVAGGEWVIAPHSELWHAWCSALAGPSGLRFRFPFMLQSQIEDELRASIPHVAE